MAHSHLNKADYPVPSRYNPYSTQSACPKALLSITLLYLLVLAFVSCGSSTGGQATHTGSTAQQKSNTQLTYVAIGASDTFGIGAYDPYNENWATDLANKLGPNVHLINLGIPGITVHGALDTELPVALDSHPNLVTIWLAVNDLVQNVPISSYSSDLNQLLSRLQANSPPVRIAVANVPDLTLLPHFSGYDPQLLHKETQDYNRAIATVVQQHHAILVDLSQQAYNSEYVSQDGLHPNTLGYAQLAELFYEVLKTS